MQYQFGYLNGQAIPAEITHRYLALWKPTIALQFDETLRLRQHKTICINDVGVSSERAAQVDELVRSFLESYFPFKSSFEL